MNALRRTKSGRITSGRIRKIRTAYRLDIEAQKRKLRRIGENILLERLERSKAQ